ncbi:MAG: sodium:solute symporter [Crocinitomicaceae bacterium]|nr:sodium:solute symporter [Crocinitomicaceae bacterium]
MSGTFILSIIIVYFLVLLIIAHFTSKEAGNTAFFTGNRASNWYLVSFGMIGASLSGITFISVPGMVGMEGFSYMQMVIGYLFGYALIAFVLLPLYYKHNLTSIYAYLGSRYGPRTHKIGASFFLVSRILGSAVRLFLVADVLDYFVLSHYGLSFEFAVFLTLLLIYIYTFKGGIKTIVWTDTLQTAFMLIALGVSIFLIHEALGAGEIQSGLQSFGLTNWFITEDFGANNYWIKGILGGFFITVAMTGLDQDMMQKNLTCKSIGDAKKNMLWFSSVLFFVNLIFLILGGLLYLYLEQNPILTEEFLTMDSTKSADRLFPLIALKGGLGKVVGITFILGLIAAAYSSADSALTALTTSTSVDIIGVDKWENKAKAEKVRKWVHIGMTIVLFLVILLANAYKDRNVINTLFAMAGYTYGPLLGLFFFGIITKRKVHDKLTWMVCLSIPAILWVYKTFEADIFEKYRTGHELLGINGLLCFLGLYLLSFRKDNKSAAISTTDA